MKNYYFCLFYDFLKTLSHALFELSLRISRNVKKKSGFEQLAGLPLIKHMIKFVIFFGFGFFDTIKTRKMEKCIIEGSDARRV